MSASARYASRRSRTSPTDPGIRCPNRIVTPTNSRLKRCLEAGLRIGVDEPDHVQVVGENFGISLIDDERPLTEHVHLAFPAQDDATVRAFHAAPSTTRATTHISQTNASDGPSRLRAVNEVILGRVPPCGGRM